MKNKISILLTLLLTTAITQTRDSSEQNNSTDSSNSSEVSDSSELSDHYEEKNPLVPIFAFPSALVGGHPYESEKARHERYNKNHKKKSTKMSKRERKERKEKLQAQLDELNAE